MNESQIEIRVQQEVQRMLTDDPVQAILLAARAIQQAQDESQKAIREITEQSRQAVSFLESHIETALMPKVEMYDIVMNTDKLFEMSAVAKILNFRNMGRNNLFEYLKGKKILRYNNEPYQDKVDAGYFKLIPKTFYVGGEEKTYQKTMISQHGIDYIGKLLLKEGYIKNE